MAKPERAKPEALVKPDPTKPMTGWRTPWRNLTRTINCPNCGELQKTGEKCRNAECGADVSKVKSPTHGLRFHDLRHHAITELAESQASDQTIMSIAGHVSAKMLAHYSHVRMDAKRKALDALSDGAPRGSYGTSSDTKPPADFKNDSQVTERNGGREGIRTLGLLVANEALSQLSYSPTSSDVGNFNMTRRADSNRVPNKLGKWTIAVIAVFGLAGPCDLAALQGTMTVAFRPCRSGEERSLQ